MLRRSLGILLQRIVILRDALRVALHGLVELAARLLTHLHRIGFDQRILIGGTFGADDVVDLLAQLLDFGARLGPLAKRFHQILLRVSGGFLGRFVHRRARLGNGGGSGRQRGMSGGDVSGPGLDVADASLGFSAEVRRRLGHLEDDRFTTLCSSGGGFGGGGRVASSFFFRCGFFLVVVFVLVFLVMLEVGGLFGIRRSGSFRICVFRRSGPGCFRRNGRFGWRGGCSGAGGLR